MTVSINGTSGLVFNDASTQNTAATGFGFKNRIINGAMGIWQRGTTYTGTGAGASQFGCVDRWAFGQFPTAYTAARSTDVPSGSVFQYSLKIQRTAGQTSTSQASIIQAIESVNMYDMAGQSVTLSFWAKAGANFSMASSAMGVIVTTGTTADQGSYASQGGWTGQAYAVNTTQVLTTSWQKFTFTATLGSTALEAAVYFYMIGVGTAGADDSMYITGVQLEKGSTATSFDYRPYGTELMMCQRYYETAGADGQQGLLLPCGCATAAGQQINTTLVYKVTKRATPIVTKVGTWVVSNLASQPNVTFAGVDSVLFYANSVAAGQGYAQNNTTSTYISISAEL